MKKNTLVRVTEESIIFLSIFKWIILAGVIGVIVGAMASFFLKILDLSTGFTSARPALYFGLPLVMALSFYITKRVSPDSEGHGTEKVIKAVHKSNGKIRLRIVPIKLFTTISTLAFGGSVGKEGPCAQIGAALASGFSQLFKFSAEDRKKLVICGISAGFSSVFGTPIAGAIFGVEVLYVGNLLYSVLLPSFISGMVSFQVATAFGVHHHYNPIAVLGSHFDAKFLIITVIAGLFFGLVSVFFIEVLHYFERLSKSLRWWAPIKGLVGGSAVIGLALIFSNDFLGLGLETIDSALAGESVVWYAFILKTVMTSVTLAFGGSGGVLTPLFFVGATSGIFFADLFHVSPVIFAAFGVVSLLAGAANTPLAACVLGVELFGPAIAPFATIACVISFFMTGYRSIFPSQVLSAEKSHSVYVKKGDEVEHCEPHLHYNTRKIIVSSRHFAKRVFRERHW